LEKLKLIQAKAGITGHLRVHDLRHTCGATLRKKGVPLETIMGILRHADIRETLIYAPYHIEEGKKAIALLDE
jgi:integrase